MYDLCVSRPRVESHFRFNVTYKKAIPKDGFSLMAGSEVLIRLQRPKLR